LEQEEENLRLKSLNQTLLEQIKSSKDDEATKNKVNNLEKDELVCLRNHNQTLLMKIKKL